MDEKLASSPIRHAMENVYGPPGFLQNSNLSFHGPVFQRVSRALKILWYRPLAMVKVTLRDH